MRCIPFGVEYVGDPQFQPQQALTVTAAAYASCMFPSKAGMYMWETYTRMQPCLLTSNSPFITETTSLPPTMQSPTFWYKSFYSLKCLGFFSI